MTQEDYNNIVAFIWKIADKVLRKHIKKGKYQDIILPMFVLRRLDLVLEGTKVAVLDRKKKLEKRKQVDMHYDLCDAAGQAFYNTSIYTLENMRCKSGTQLKKSFDTYLKGFSSNVMEILNSFQFSNQVKILSEKDILLSVIQRFLDSELDLSTLDNHAMGTVFEELVRKFNEESNEKAGEYWTPRDAVHLMTKLVFSPVESLIGNGTYGIYDGACGTGGMLTVSEDVLKQISRKNGVKANCILYGQESQPETYAVCRADMLLRSKNAEESNDEFIKLGSTLSEDKYEGKKFDFMLSNPPYGTDWEEDSKIMGGRDNISDIRFVVEGHGKNNERLPLLPRISDGQLLFLANAVCKMNDKGKFGARVAQVHNGSSLFTGEAGSGESNIRRWIVENDWLEAIIALPINMFYNTGITTYIWVISNKKDKKRKGKVQLIDASEWFVPLRRNLGKKNCKLSDKDIENIMSLFLKFKKSDKSKIFQNKEFGYQKIIVQRPLRLRGRLSEKSEKALLFASGDHELREKIYKEFGERLFSEFSKIQKKVEKFVETLCGDDETENKVKENLAKGKTWARDWQISQHAADLRKVIGGEVFGDYNIFRRKVREVASELKINNSEIKAILKKSSWRDPDAPRVEKDRTAHKVAEPLYGIYDEQRSGKKVIIEYELDSELKDTEQVPLLEPKGIEGFIEREVRPYAPDVWVEKEATKIGYEINFNRYFYKPQQLRELTDIRADIEDVRKNTKDLLDNLLAGTQS